MKSIIMIFQVNTLQKYSLFVMLQWLGRGSLYSVWITVFKPKISAFHICWFPDETTSYEMPLWPKYLKLFYETGPDS
jgi:hypothetical protein